MKTEHVAQEWTLRTLNEALEQLAREQESFRDFAEKSGHTLEAAYENHRADVARREADYARELNAKLEQINAQAKTIRELIIALEKVVRVSSISWDDQGHNAVANAKNALAKVKTYPLPAQPGERNNF